MKRNRCVGQIGIFAAIVLVMLLLLQTACAEHYLLLCTDKWEGSRGNTDGILIVSTDAEQNKVLLTSVMRDVLITDNVGEVRRINTVVRSSGAEALCDILQKNLGLRFDGYALLNLTQVEQMIQ